jgi:hypothetical protein
MALQVYGKRRHHQIYLEFPSIHDLTTAQFLISVLLGQPPALCKSLSRTSQHKTELLKFIQIVRAKKRRKKSKSLSIALLPSTARDDSI